MNSRSAIISAVVLALGAGGYFGSQHIQNLLLAAERKIPVCDATDCSGYFFDRLYANHELEPYGFDFKKRLVPGLISASELLALLTRAKVVQDREAPPGNLVFFYIPLDDTDSKGMYRVGIYLGAGRFLMPVGSRFATMNMDEPCGVAPNNTFQDCLLAYSDTSQLPWRDAAAEARLLKVPAEKLIQVGSRVAGGIYVPPAIMREALRGGGEAVLLKKLGDMLAAKGPVK